jgi:alpha-amylase/alpha-mannosidase (GH57 family)
MSSDRPALVIHGHFYQPPRENPWTAIVDREPSAAPFPHWNERIYDECYRRNAFARVVDDQGQVVRIINNYRGLSFNFGATLMSWLERQHPRTHARIVDADRRSVAARGGHGNAIAQGYNHAILPLCSERDLRTQIRWGVGDFRYRFGRQPESLWLPETACNDRVLGALVDEGLRFVLLAPGQAARIRKLGSGDWHDVSDGSIDPRRAYRWTHPDGTGRSIALFFYDGAISRAVAFEGVLASSYDLVGRFEGASQGAGSLVHIATDGESYGHHFRGGERCLAYTIDVEAPRRGFWLTNYGEWLDRYPPAWEAQIKAGEDGLGTAWSCSHGIGRWHRDCGCHTGGKPGWTQGWRKPLREALDLLRDEAALGYERLSGDLCDDPWALRDAYIEPLCDREADRGAFFERELGRRPSAPAQLRLLRLLEMQRSSMLMYSSCGWFFSELSGLEAVQVMRYAGRLLDQLDRLGVSVRSRFLEALAEAKSNLPAKGTGADIFRQEVQPSRVTTAAIAAHVGLAYLAADLPAGGEVAGHRYELRELNRRQAGRLRLATGLVSLQTQRTGARSEYGMAAIHFGGIDVYCVLKGFPNPADFARAAARLWNELDSASLLTIVRIAEEEFGPEEYGLEHVLAGGRDAVARAILADSISRYAEQYERLFEDNRRLIAMFRAADLPLPDELRVAAEITLTRRLELELERQRDRSDAKSYRRAVAIAAEAQRFGFELRCAEGRARFEAMIESLVRRVVEGDREAAEPEVLGSALELLELTDTLGIAVSLDRAQEMLYQAAHNGLPASEAIQQLVGALGLSPTILSRAPTSFPGPLLEGPGSRRPGTTLP